MTSESRATKKYAAYLVIGVTLAAFLLLNSFADWASLTAEPQWLGQGTGGVMARLLFTSGKSKVQPVDRPRIYIYDLPTIFHECDAPDHEDRNYAAEHLLPTRLAASAFITKNPKDADLFYVPAYTYCLQSEGRLAVGTHNDAHRWIAVKVLEHIREAHPYWNRTQGADHVWLFTHDHGFCGFMSWGGGIPELENSIVLSHWGLANIEFQCHWDVKLRSYGACHERDTLPATDPHTMLCFRPGQDVVIPHVNKELLPVLEEAPEAPADAPRTLTVSEGVARDAGSPSPDTLFFRFRKLVPDYNGLLNQPQDPQSPEPKSAVAAVKNNTIFFSGDPRYEELHYSYGVRQTFMLLFNDTPGFKVVNSREERPSKEWMLLEMGRSTFCLTPTGDGWGTRLKLAVMFRCIPVVINQDVQMEFEDILPYKDFAIRVEPHQVFALPKMLQHLLDEPGRVAAMQERLACVWQFFIWHPEHGRALEALMCALRMKLPDLRSSVKPSLDWETCTLQCS